jgi:hypothetical protein
MSASIWTPGSNNVPAVDPLSQIASQRFTATEGQTAFVISAFTYAINVGALTVYVNRTKIPTTEITETSESTFTLLQPCDVGDLVEVIGQTAIEDPGNAVAIAEAAAAAAAASAAQAAASESNAAQDAADAAASAALAASLVPIDWRGDWVTATLYEHNDAVFHVDGSYICTTIHTSTDWVSDSANWELLAQSGGTVSVNGQTGVVILTADDIPFLPAGSIAANNVNDALVELDNEKVRTGSATPSMNGLASPGIDTDEASRQDHVHPRDTSKANLVTSVQKSSDVAGMFVPAGTTAERDATPQYGEQRANSTLNQQEWWNGTAWVPMGGGATGASGNPVIFENDIHVTGDYTITTGKNGMSAGPIIVDNGVTVTVPSGSVWSVI